MRVFPRSVSNFGRVGLGQLRRVKGRCGDVVNQTGSEIGSVGSNEISGRVDTEISKLESKKFKPLSLDKASQAPRLHISSSVNMGISYSIFSLFFTGEIFKKISHSINFYAQLNRVSDSESKISPG